MAGGSGWRGNCGEPVIIYCLKVISYCTMSVQIFKPLNFRYIITNIIREWNIHGKCNYPHLIVVNDAGK